MEKPMLNPGRKLLAQVNVAIPDVTDTLVTVATALHSALGLPRPLTVTMTGLAVPVSAPVAFAVVKLTLNWLDDNPLAMTIAVCPLKNVDVGKLFSVTDCPASRLLVAVNVTT